MKKTNMKKAELNIFKKESQIKHFVLFNYADIKNETPEYIEALASLTGKNKTDLKRTITSSLTEVELTNNLIKK